MTNTLAFTESHPAWSPSEVFEADIATSPAQRNYLQIRRGFTFARVDGELKKVPKGRWSVVRIAEPGGERIPEKMASSHFDTVEEARAAAQEWFVRYWLPLLAAKHAREERLAKQFTK